MPVLISDEDLRAAVLRAAGRLRDEGRRITVDSLRSAGARGGDERLMRACEALVREGLVDLDHFNAGRDRRTRIPASDVRAPARSGRRGGSRPRHPSRRLVRQYRAAWTSIRKILDPPRGPGRGGPKWA